MLVQSVCHFNKYGFCRFGRNCFRYHEDKICENESCKVFECKLRHPRKCRYFENYFYCKFGTFCKFSHGKINEGKSIKLLEKEIEGVKKDIQKKDKEIQEINDQIEHLEERIESQIYIISQKNDVMEKEIIEIKEENKEIKSKLHLMEKEIEALKELGMQKPAEMNALDDENEAVGAKSEILISCEKCEFIAKSEAGLKTHNTVKHKTSLMRAYTKVSR